MKKFLISVALLSLASGLIACNGETSSTSSTSTPNTSSSESSTEKIEEKLTILMKYESLSLGSEDKTLEVTITPSTLSQEVNWTSSNEEVAIVTNGVLKVKNIGKTKITATSVVNSNLHDSFELTVTGTVITGLVKDLDGNPLDGAKITYFDKTTNTDKDGKYSISLEDNNLKGNLIVEKTGYRTQTIDMTSLIKDGLVNKDIMLIPSEGKMNLSFTGKVENIIDGSLQNVQLKINEEVVQTNEEGRFTFNNVSVEGTFIVSASKEGYAEYKKEFILEDYISQINENNKTIELGTIDLYSYQDEINIYTSGVKHVSGQIYRTLEGLKFVYNANFDITTNSFFYELFLDFGNSNPSDLNRTDTRDMDFQITYEGIRAENKYNDTFGEGKKEFKYYVNDSNYIIEVMLQYTYLKMDSDEIFGFNVITHDDGVSDRSMNLFGNMVEWYNYYTYPRVGLNNRVYQSNYNKNPFNLKADDVVSSVELGTVGESDNYKYKISLARDNNGLYIIADKANKDIPYLQDGTSYHFFIDTNQDNFDRDTDSQVVHFKLESGRWLKKYKVNHAYAVFDDEKGTIDLLNIGVKFITEEAKSIIYIPYTVLGTSFTRSSTLGIAANIEEGDNNWKAWQAPYISNYINTPHVEEIKSFVRLSSDLVVIPTL